MTANEAVTAVVDALTRLGVPYMLAGGYAVNFYGVARSTRDADFVVELPSGKVAELSALLGQGFRLDRQLSFETVTATSRLIFSLVEIPFKVELFFLSDDPHDQARFARRVRVQAWDREIFVPTAEDLLIMKLRWSRQGRRAKDTDDVRAMVAVQGARLDWDYVQRWCDQHGTRELLDEIRRSTPVV